MADHSPETAETPAGVIRGIIGTLAFAAGFEGVVMIMHADFAIGIVGITASVALSTLAYKWPAIHSRLAQGGITVSTNVAVIVWVAMVVALILGLAYSPILIRTTVAAPAPEVSPAADTEPQKATLIEWLRQAQSERDQAKQQLVSIQSTTREMEAQVAALQSQLSVVTNKNAAQPIQGSSYLKNLRLSEEDTRKRGIALEFTAKVNLVSAHKYSVYVDYLLLDNPATGPKRVGPIGEITATARDLDAQITIVSAPQTRQALFWGATTDNMIPHESLTWPVYPIHLRIAIVGENGEEQHYYATVLRSITQQALGR